ncbi:MAG: RNA pseudouridine synthase [Spirochaetaceae bacterium]|nr:RNA pseudouridine synthase [Spirochaetaceae bacterium]
MLTILHEDAEILIIDKPAGLAAQPGEGVGSSVLSLIEADFHFKPYPVHRLDKETSGCMIIAKSSEAASRWSELVTSRKIRKLYWAVCAGAPEQDSGSYEDSLEINGRIMKAQTSYRCLARHASGTDPADNGIKCFSLLELELGSGRMHQIRRHLAMHGLPIVGDDKYGNFLLNRQLRKKKDLKHLLLWARCLELDVGVRVQASIPQHFALFLDDWPEIQVTMQ